MLMPVGAVRDTLKIPVKYDILTAIVINISGKSSAEIIAF
jgi:hypothetical protein